MKKTLYLHIGMDKTGTSAIQRFLHENRMALYRTGNIYCPETGLWKDLSHHPFAFSIFGMEGHTPKSLDKLFFDLTGEIEGKDVVLMSSECLFRAPTSTDFRCLWDKIERVFSKMKILGYVRRQDEWVESAHKHSILSGQELSLEQLQRPFFCDYKQYFDAWADIVGKRNVMVRPYEKRQFRGGSILSDFLSVFGVTNLTPYRMDKDPVNLSLGLCETEFKRYSNDLKLPNVVLDRLNVALLDHSKTHENSASAKYYLSPGQRKRLIEKYTKTNDDLAMEYGRQNRMFRELAPDTKKGWTENKAGLGRNMSEIFKFLRDRDKKLFDILAKETIAGKRSCDERKKRSAKILGSAIEGLFQT